MYISLILVIFIAGVWVGGWASRRKGAYGHQADHGHHGGQVETHISKTVERVEEKEEKKPEHAEPKFESKPEPKMEIIREETVFKKAIPPEKENMSASSHIAKQKEKKEANKRIIMAVLEGKTEGLTNEEIEELLDVSDATVNRYMEELENEGKIEQIGRSGQAVNYKKVE